MNGEYIRALATSTSSSRPAARGSTGDAAPWPDGAFDDGGVLGPWPRSSRSGWPCSARCRPWSTSSSSTPRSSTRTRGPRRWSGDDGATGHPRRRPSSPTRRCVTTGRRPPSTPPPWRVAESVGRKLGKAQAPIRMAVTGRRVGPPLFEALEVLGPDRTLARLRAAADLLAAGARRPRDRLAASAPGRAADPGRPRDPACSASACSASCSGWSSTLLIGRRRLPRRDRLPGVATGQQLRAPGRRGHRGHGRGPVQRGAVARPAGPARAGRAAVAPALLVHDHGDRLEGAGRRLHRGAGFGPLPGDRSVSRPPTSCRPAGATRGRTCPRRRRSSSPAGTPTCWW